MKSDMIEIRAWAMIISSNWALVKQVPGVSLFHALAIGLHWKIHSKVRTTLLTTRAIMAP